MVILKIIQNLIVKPIISNDIYNDILLLPEQRKGYSKNIDTLILPVYFYRIIGIEQTSEDDYYNSLYNLEYQIKTTKTLYNRIDTRLDTQVPQFKIDSINKIWNEIKADTNLRSQYICSNFYGAGIIKYTKSNIHDSLIRDAFQTCLDIFISLQNKPMNPSIIKNFCIKLLFWFEKYSLDLFKSYNFQNANPKIIFYGDIKRDEIFFMILLHKIGFDILYFNPFSDARFKEVDPQNKYSAKLEFEDKEPIKPFPTVERVVSVQTIAYQAEKSIEDIVSNENTNFFKPWQFEDYNIKSVSLKTTYEELFVLWNTQARFRDGFKASNNTIYIPNIFAKINGTHKNKQDYWSDILKLTSETNDNKGYISVIDKVPFCITKTTITEVDKKIYFRKNGELNIEGIRISSVYQYSFLKTAFQNLILDKLNEIIQKNYFSGYTDQNFKNLVVCTILNINIDLLKQLQMFDYPYFVPKIVIFHNSDKLFRVEDYIIIAFFNSIGFDIVVISPAGYNSIENSIPHGLIDIHNLRDGQF